MMHFGKYTRAQQEECPVAKNVTLGHDSWHLPSEWNHSNL